MQLSVAEGFMRIALAQARLAFEIGEVPIGAVICRGNEIIAQAHNLVESTNDPTAHAEMLAIRAAAKQLGDWRLNGCTLIVTLEPCGMCAGACANSRLDGVVFGAFDEQAGFCTSVADLPRMMVGNALTIAGGVLERECANLLSTFFEQKRVGGGTS